MKTSETAAEPQERHREMSKTTTLHTSRLVQRLNHSKDPATAWRYECSLHKSWMDDEPLMRANGFASTEEEAQAKADAWQPRTATIDGLEALISEGEDLLRTEAYVPSLEISIVVDDRRDDISWRVPAQGLAPLLAPVLYGVRVEGMSDIELRGRSCIPFSDRRNAEALVAKAIGEARSCLRAAGDAARTFADRVNLHSF